MKFRQDFVTNSSSASYIICFARIADEVKAKVVLEKFNLETLCSNEVRKEKRWTGYLGAEWANAELYGTDEILEEHPNDKYIIIEDYINADWDEDSYDYIYDYNFSANKIIDCITEENGFADIDIAEGEGYNG